MPDIQIHVPLPTVLCQIRQVINDIFKAVSSYRLACFKELFDFYI